MQPADDLIGRIRAYNPQTNADLISRAYEFGKEMHEGQFRHSGEPYFTHPIAVATLLADQRLDDATIVTALLHDTIEDTRASYSQVADQFGAEIAELVDGVTKLTQLQLSRLRPSRPRISANSLWPLRATSAWFWSSWDRLHNMRTIKAMKPEKQVQKSRETMDIFAPLSGAHGHAVHTRRA